ncbi:UBX domain-containing protein 6 [Nephila pilipes]|uniref:UBX domain-containing protein 6 n=1 Tax=Nephila pilipes TaxID=299642 RepID=A0A8X6N538_NEPPI|nr:UBX domain-containing protein 6 [Nephila pilipes]
MSAIRDFFRRKKAELKFQTAGPGHRLNESSNKPKNSGPPLVTTQPSRHQPSEGAQRAGAAALARIEQKQTTSVNWSVQATKAQARREIELENASKIKQTSTVKKDLNMGPRRRLNESYSFLGGPEGLRHKKYQNLQRGQLTHRSRLPQITHTCD